MWDPRLPARGIAAHRGGAHARPENTLAAIREAVRLGAHQIEVDLRRTRDGKIVVIHDATVERTTNGRGAVSELSLAELKRLDASGVPGGDFAGERIPTLGEVLDSVPDDVWLNLQVKRGEPIAGEVVRLLVDRKRLHQAFLACGNSAACEARAVEARIALCNLVRQGSRREYLEHAIATGSDFIQLHHWRGLPEPELVARAHDAGVLVNYSAGAERCSIAALFDAGIDFILVDDLPWALAEAARLGIAPRSNP